MVDLDDENKNSFKKRPIIATIILLVCFSCKEHTVDKKTDQSIPTNQASENDVVVKIRNFDESTKLFLNLYKGMNRSEYITVIRKNVDSAMLYLNEPNPNNFISGPLKESDLVINDSVFDYSDIYGYSYKILYPLTIQGEKYFMRIVPLIDDKKHLRGIELSGPVFKNTDTSNFDDSILDEALQFKKRLLILYSNKYGKPIVESRIDNEDKSLMQAHIRSLDDTDKYIFRANRNVVQIKQSGPFTYSAIYLTTSEYDSIITEKYRKKDNNLKRLEEEELRAANQI